MTLFAAARPAVFRALAAAVAAGAIALSASPAAGQCASARDRTRPDWAYRFETETTSGGLVLHVTAQLPLDARGGVSVQLPAHWAGETLHAMTHLRAVSSGVSLTVDATGENAEIHGPPKTVATIAYDLEKDWTGSLIHPLQFHPVLTPEYFEVTGNNALVFPRLDTPAKLAARTVVQFDFSAMPPSWTLATSFGSTATADGRCQTATVPAVDIVHALFAAGDFRLRPFLIRGRSAMLAVRGTWTFSDDDAIAQIQQVVGMVRAFWNDDEFPYFLVTLKPFDRDRGSSDGSAFTNAFWMYVSRQDSLAGLLTQLAHESFHAWNPLKMGVQPRDEDHSWFIEGFTTYYASRLSVQAGVVSASSYVRSINQALRQFPSTDDPYIRGQVVALWLDAAIRRESHDRHSLDDVMFDMVRTRDQPLSTDRIVRTIGSYVSSDTRAALQNAVLRRGVLEAPEVIPFAAACGKPSAVEVPSFDLGLDLSASRAAGKLIGVRADGPAYAAGLRDGQVLDGRLSVTNGDPTRQAIVSIRDDAGPRVIQFTPRGPDVHAWQYDAASCAR